MNRSLIGHAPLTNDRAVHFHLCALFIHPRQLCTNSFMKSLISFFIPHIIGDSASRATNVRVSNTLCFSFIKLEHDENRQMLQSWKTTKVHIPRWCWQLIVSPLETISCCLPFWKKRLFLEPTYLYRRRHFRFILEKMLRTRWHRKVVCSLYKYLWRVGIREGDEQDN